MTCHPWKYSWQWGNRAFLTVVILWKFCVVCSKQAIQWFLSILSFNGTAVSFLPCILIVREGVHTSHCLSFKKYFLFILQPLDCTCFYYVNYFEGLQWQTLLDRWDKDKPKCTSLKLYSLILSTGMQDFILLNSGWFVMLYGPTCTYLAKPSRIGS